MDCMLLVSPVEASRHVGTVPTDVASVNEVIATVSACAGIQAAFDLIRGLVLRLFFYCRLCFALTGGRPASPVSERGAVFECRAAAVLACLRCDGGSPHRRSISFLS